MAGTTWAQILRTKETKIFFAITVIVVILDQLTKYLIETNKPLIYFLFIKIQYTTNTGAGFGILKNNSFILGIVSLLAVILIIYYYPKIPQTKLNSTIAGLLLAGTIGNGIDRLTKQYVVDFIATTFWPSFNVADAAITVSVIGLIILSIKEHKENKVI